MADAVPTTPQADQVTAIDVQFMHIDPPSSTVSYQLRLTWQSGKITYADTKVIAVADFLACIGSFCQATPKKKFLNWLVTAGYETNITVN